ncbi:glycosyltransferase family 4 protein [Vibrio vulnificus]|nr:glycosyltransferase family 4 protein [Vibrio vulnificus]ELC9581323.1 glycosyltransferase family 4 protein [Vibrio vulnificus]ELV8662359.1 glycosyltransferase family 4 protein [Vibrio vulnificus]
MKSVNVCLEHRFYEYEGKLYTKLAFSYSYWSDYLQYFDSVNIVARVKKVEVYDELFSRVDGYNVTFTPVPYYVGIKQFIKSIFKLILTAAKVSNNYGGFILRTGNVSNLIWLFLMLKRRPYLREYPGNIEQGILGFVGDKWYTKSLAKLLNYLAKTQGRFSVANSFVSKDCSLIYGSSKPGYIFSSFNSQETRKFRVISTRDTLDTVVFVGRLEGEKGHLNFLNSIVEDCELRNLDYVFIGDGSKKLQLEKFALQHGVNARFYGAITDREKMFGLISSADLYCIPSLTEGMPRSLLEAMSLGLPCIGSNVGGIPEVLEKDALFEPLDSESILTVLRNFKSKVVRKKNANRNYSYVMEHYSIEALNEKKIMYWSSLYE